MDDGDTVIKAETPETTMTDDGDVCGICSDQDKRIVATQKCTNCSELLCDQCAAVHQAQKFAKNHVIINVMDAIKKTRDKDEACEPCVSMAKYSKASMFCDNCQEKLCVHCTKAHKSQKLTKLHLLISISEYRRSRFQMCEPCSERGKTENATVCCIVCEEDLCPTCEKIHKSQKATRDHETVDISLKGKATETNAVQGLKLKCEPCKEIGEDKLAAEMCKNCKEYLCTRCATFHKMRKATKGHKLFAVDLVPIVLCDPCNEHGERRVSIQECAVCSERLCESCSKLHSVQKATRSHELKEISTLELHECDSCSYNGKDAIAFSYCEQCIEYFCDGCSQMHSSQKATKEHKLVKASEARERSSSDDLPQSSTVYQMEPTTSMDSPNKTEKNQEDLRPGKPVADTIQSDSVCLRWEAATFIESDAPTYQLRFKEKADKRWTFYAEQPHGAYVTVNGLKSQCTYIFQVRVIDGDIEGPYGSESNEVHTKSSLATRLVSFTTKVKDGKPSIHKLHSTENISARNPSAKTRKFDLGKPPIINCKEKTILLVGATGTGKSTLVDGIINYVTGVNWKDPFRFSLIDLEKDEVNKNQALSQTEWITSYSLNTEEGSRLDYKLNIIDTPGFGDTRGLERDNEIISQLRELFSSKGTKGVLYIDAVCFLIKAPDARLTAVQKYIFMSILSLFGQDIEENICTLITFADGDTPPVLAAMQEAKLPSRNWYPFNNSGLFASNEDEQSTLAPIFWEMGINSFTKFFNSLCGMPTKSLLLTKKVLQERERLEATISQLQPQVDAGLSKVHELKQEVQILTQNERKIKDNQDFEYEVEETKAVKIDFPPGEYVTNCFICNQTCHYPCGIPKDTDKSRCAAMKDGYCTVCPKKCYWDQHCNNPYRFTFVTDKVKKTYAGKLKMYQEAGKQKITHEQVIEKMGDDLEYLGESIDKMMAIVNECNNTLKEIALHPHPLSMVEHIDLMIASEKLEKKIGFNERINVLQAYRKKTEIHKDIDKLKKEVASTSGTGTPTGGKKKNRFWSRLFFY